MARHPAIFVKLATHFRITHCTLIWLPKGKVEDEQLQGAAELG
jgi:hypothetical protein